MCPANLRQMFWLTVAFSLASGLIGFWLSTHDAAVSARSRTSFGPSGVIVITSVGLFFGSMIVVAVWNRFAPIFGGKQFRRSAA